MTETKTGPARLAADPAGPDAAGRSNNRLAIRLRALLHAQALLRARPAARGMP